MNDITNELNEQLLSQESGDPFLTLLTLQNGTTVIRLVSNSSDIVSNGETFTAIPMKLTLPTDDGETARSFKIVIDNIMLDLIVLLRTVVGGVTAKVDMILASTPDVIQMSYENLALSAITYDKTSITATFSLDNFLQIAMTSEQYTPSNFPGIFS